MHSRTRAASMYRPLRLPLEIALVSAIAMGSLSACSESSAASDEIPVGSSASQAALTDAPLAPWRSELLDVAFDAASAFPLNPHVKNRSRAQAEVLATCLELDQAKRVQVRAEEIANWRRGDILAELALRCARQGDAANAEPCSRRALDLANALENDPDEQAWRRDRIRAKVGAALVWLGRAEEARALAKQFESSESAPVEVAEALLIEPDAFDGKLAAMRKIAASGDLDAVRASLAVCSALYERFYADPDRRALALSTIESCWAKAPLMIRIEVLMDLAETALDHDDGAQALALADRAYRMTVESSWIPEDEIRLCARAAALRARAGDPAVAREQVDAALALFDAESEQIVNIYRAGALRSIAEAYRALGDRDAALALYARALEAGVENPNSRPRADDLCTTCCSMALLNVEPDPMVMERIKAIRAGLAEPW
jgi:hypothetical protein